MLPVVLACAMWAILAASKVEVHCDNMAIVHILNYHSSKESRTPRFSISLGACILWRALRHQATCSAPGGGFTIRLLMLYLAISCRCSGNSAPPQHKRPHPSSQPSGTCWCAGCPTGYQPAGDPCFGAHCKQPGSKHVTDLLLCAGRFHKVLP